MRDLLETASRPVRIRFVNGSVPGLLWSVSDKSVEVLRAQLKPGPLANFPYKLLSSIYQRFVPIDSSVQDFLASFLIVEV
mmetsp:Transcript_10146/g.36756  ORF Transcript_10146/g.36756 Transcript_10146/m.36756 type:complete len:80 (+) Transcript_10146:402-641(+)